MNVNKINMGLNFDLKPTVTITKDFLLSKYSDEVYMGYYTGLTIKKGLFCSPLREDHKPTIAFYRNPSGDLIYKDFGDNTHVNFIGFVMKKYNCNYYQALKIIAEDFGLIKSEKVVRVKVPSKPLEQKFLEKTPSVIQVEVQDFTEADLKWWAQFGINRRLLKKYKVFSCKYVFLNNNVFATSSDRCPIFGYYFGKKDNLELWKIYMPTRKTFRFINNLDSKILQGYNQLPKEGPLLVITKSQKDIMALSNIGIPAVAPNSEHLFLEDSVLDKLKSRFKNIVVFYDSDKTGLTRLAQIRREHPELRYVFLPKCTKCKDFSDYVKMYGVESAKNIATEYITWIKKDNA